MWSSFLLPLAIGTAVAEYISYDGYKAFKVPFNGDVEALKERLSDIRYDEWQTTSDSLYLSMSANDAKKFEEIGLEFSVMHEDLGKSIAEEKAYKTNLVKRNGRDSLLDNSWFDSYHPYEDHVKWWKDLTKEFPFETEYFLAPGKSVEGREIFGVKITGSSKKGAIKNAIKKWKNKWTGKWESADKGKGGKSAIIWHGTVHAREWITTPTVEYLALEMLEGYRKRDRFWRDVLDEYEVYILPVVNPDGLIYSWDVNRLWRKNRSPPPPLPANQSCFGVDNNRNWPYQWEASTNPCAQTFSGTGPSSTPENTALVAHAKSVTDKQHLALFVDWHSFGQLLLSPYGYTCELEPPNFERAMDVSNKTARAIASVYGREYEFGPGCRVLYRVTGGSRDYFLDAVGSDYSFTFELRGGVPAETGSGFILPPAEIRPNCEEVTAGMKAMLGSI